MTQRGPNKEIFGQIDEGPEKGLAVHRVQLNGGGLSANIMTWGATIQDLRLAGHEPSLVLGFDTFAPYPKYSSYFGATVGRLANRIGNATFDIDGQRYNTDPNNNEKHTLHGGSLGVGKRLWKIADLGTSHVDLTLSDPDGMMGFPGKCELTCSYSLKENGVLHIVYTTRTDAATVAGLAHHSYFNLDGGDDCRSHDLQILAEHYLPVDGELIPTGEVACVENTPFDFRERKFINRDLTDGVIYDHNFCLSDARRGLQDVASAHYSHSGITMMVATTEPGLQFYAGHKVNTPVAGLGGASYGAYAGFCLETQNWPDAPNNKGFPTSVLRPGEELRQTTEYRFSKG